MLALGLCNIFGSFSRSMPTTGSFTRTAVNNASGVKTPMGGVITGSLVLLACGLLTSTFEFIPKATLAAVIIVAMYYMLELHIFLVLWRTKSKKFIFNKFILQFHHVAQFILANGKRKLSETILYIIGSLINLFSSRLVEIDLIPLTVTLLSCLAIGPEYGMIAGILVNLILLLYFAARPGLLIEERVVDGLTILFVSPKQSLSYPAAEYLRERVMSWWIKFNNKFLTIVNPWIHKLVVSF